MTWIIHKSVDEHKGSTMLTLIQTLFKTFEPPEDVKRDSEESGSLSIKATFAVIHHDEEWQVHTWSYFTKIAHLCSFSHIMCLVLETVATCG